MPPKSAMDCITEMKACQAQLDRELKQVQDEANHEEKQHVEEAAWEKWRREEEAAVRKKKATEAEAARERCEQEEARTWVARYEACMKMLVPLGEPIVALGSDLDIESGVRLLGVTDLVCENFSLLVFI